MKANLTNLFKWKKKVDIKDDNDSTLATVYVKLAGDSVYQEARNTALRESKKLRMKLRDTSSEEHEVNFMDIESNSKEELIMGIVVSEMSDYRDEAFMALPDQEVPELPESPTLEQQEEHQAKLDNLKNERVQAISDFINKRTEERREELRQVEDIEELKERYKIGVINSKCTELFTTIFRSYCVFRGTFEDSNCTKSAFDSFDEFKECSPKLKDQLIRAYSSLEISGEELKN